MRNETDRPYSIIRQRAAAVARNAGVSLELFWTEMNYASLVGPFRVAMSKEGRCVSCGHRFLNEDDIQI